MQELEITWQRVAHIWWAWLWRSLALSVVCGGVLGFLIGFIGAMLGFRDVTTVTTVVSITVGAIVAVAMLVTALKKTYRGFRVVLLAQEESAPLTRQLTRTR
jgi:uncharacterized membrane protein